NYRPHAYRLLLSKRDIRPGLITSYDPAKDAGPLRLKDGQYYWNAAYTSEFMIEDDLSLDRCTDLKFVTHHSQYCGPFGNECEDRKNQPTVHRTGSKMLSFVLGNGLHVLDKHLKTSGANDPFMGLNIGYQGLEASLPSQVKFGGPIAAEGACQDVMRG